ncbi:MAG: ATP synthase F0 subunit B [Firmicutes bacterium]|nr:ATP synthase F0 subunit B [Bacillota bacterium]MCL1954099.1 ATP synthase F0 subunit B [Bacillota bacterium]
MNIIFLQTFIATNDSLPNKLGISWQEILFHAISLVVLVAVLWFLLYKPVKKIIAERRAKLDEVFLTNQKLKAESEKLKVETEELLIKAKQDALSVATQATVNAEEKAKLILQQAEQKAAAIVSIAHKESMVEVTRMQNELKENAADMIINLAGKLIGKEITSTDNEKFIEECLSSWEDS